ncbi:helix-turn-helix domain-containing protein [Massilia endophytica]|uniref:helix-turn-helix domain-containing protein n=1 Tax=Massilia endophytica TaxID=2899220 RepID=UPI001E2FBAF0|nr:helix-turn-helix transcriptional regulator [Massilia endophytica]UGQ44573.1 helix-turn-helix transcriptional regulator [Massilia endophytica]
MNTPAAVGHLLREWRAARRYSQLDLALESDTSARHLSCIETGKAQASRNLLMRLADVLDMPLRERNALLRAGGYAPKFPETSLDSPRMEQINRAIQFILDQQEPYPAFLMNRHWDVLAATRGAFNICNFLRDGRPEKHTNMLLSAFDPDDVRGAIVNWDDVASTLIGHLHALVSNSPTDTRARALLDEILAFPDIPDRWRCRDLDTPPAPLLNTVFRHRGVTLQFFSTITTFGTPRDITAEELHIESCFPMDEDTARFCRELAQGEPDAIAAGQRPGPALCLASGSQP